ncbi:MAG: AAA family ATPase [Persicimonas sp.]
MSRRPPSKPRRTVDFTNAVIIMTSNVGSHHIQEYGLDDPERANELVEEELRATFRPEFLNRLDDTIIFHGLTRGHMDRIVEIQLGDVEELLAERGFSLELTEQAKGWLADRGYDPVYGARPLKRVLQREVQNQLAKNLLRGDFEPGSTIFAKVDETGDALEFSASLPPSDQDNVDVAQ